MSPVPPEPPAVEPRFVHLHVHSEYSLADGLADIKALVKATAAAGMSAVAVTDLSNLFAMVRFYKAAIGAGVKPIVGVDAWLRNPADPARPDQAVLLVQNERGYRNLTRLISRAYRENQHLGRALLEPEWLMAANEGLIVLSGGREGDVGRALLADRGAEARQLLDRWLAAFGDRYYLELIRTGRPNEEDYLYAAVALAAAKGVPVVATNDVRFLAQGDFQAHEVRVCIHGGRILDDPRRPRPYSEEQFLRSPEEMALRFADLPEALANSVEIAKRCNLELSLGKYFLPAFPVPAGMTVDDYFVTQSRAGLAARLAGRPEPVPGAPDWRAGYERRLETELGVITSMGFTGYFLIVADFIQWAKRNGVPVGPGRGSGAGSLVAYALGITDLDPIEHDLLFERFLNPERVSMPDFDIDFCMEGRDRVIDYVAQKYGRDSVSQIITYGSLAVVDKIAKLVPFELGITLDKALADSEELRARYVQEEEVRELIDMARKLEGLARNAGKHAGGVVIAPGALTDFAPLYCEPGGENLVTQFDKDDVEQVGLVKFDFLGLRTLTIIDWALKTINAGCEAPIDIAHIPMDDPEAFALLKRCETAAVFQLESRGMRELIKKLQPDSFDDITALVALYRPGPLQSGMVEDFINRKHGRAAIAYPHPALEPILKPTYGVILYQEQVMQIAQVLAGYTLGGADLLRRAMGEKKPEEMAQQREVFRAGALAKGIGQAKADEVFDLMEKFAGYGFNKSHAAAYSVLAYHTAWVKVHCAAEFYAANMTVEMDDTDKLRVLLDDAKAFGVQFDPPDINRGVWRFEPVADDRVRYGLGAIKGTGQGAIEAIVAARDGTGAHEGQGSGPFRSLFDFCARVDRQRVNKRVVEALVKAGAFDALQAERAGASRPGDAAPAGGGEGDRGRAELLASVGLAFDWAEAQAAHANQAGLFDFGHDGEVSHAASTHEPALAAAAPWSPRERLTNEKAALGLHLSGHLFEQHAAELRRVCPTPIAELADSRELQLVAGIVGAPRLGNGPRGRVMIFALDDGSDRIETVVGDELLDANRECLREDELLVVQGRVQLDRFGAGLRLNAQQLWDLAGARARFGRYLQVVLNGVPPPVAEVLRQWPARKASTEQGETRQGLGIRLQVERGGAAAELDLGDDARFWPSDEALALWRRFAADARAEVVYR